MKVLFKKKTDEIFFKILFFIFTVFIITVEEANSFTVVNILQEKTSYTFFQESQLSTIVFENHSEISCLKGISEVIWRGQCAESRGIAAKGGVQYTKSSLQMGQQMHKTYHAGEVGKEFRLLSGKRIDFLDIKNSTIYELKPFNPRAMQQGQRQLNMYLKELQFPAMLQKYPEFRGINWKTVLDTY